MQTFQEFFDLFQTITLPTIFITNYLPRLSQNATLFYLFLLYQNTANASQRLNFKGDFLNEENPSISNFQSVFRKSEEEEAKAINELCNVGLLRLEKSDQGEPIFILKDIQFENLAKTHALRPEYLMDQVLETPVYSGDSEEQLFVQEIVERFFGGILSAQMADLILKCLHTYGFDQSLMYAFLNQMKELGQLNSFPYCKKVAEVYYQKGFRTYKDFEKSELEFDQIKTLQTKVEQFLNIKLNQEHLKWLKKWHFDWGFSYELIEHAFKQGLNTKSGTANFPYYDKVLQAWHEAGYKSLDQIEDANKRFQQTNKQDKKARYTVSQIGKSKNPTHFNGRSRSTDFYEKILKDI